MLRRHPYGGRIRFAEVLFGSLDEVLTRLALRHYRERVWWDPISLLATKSTLEEQLVIQKLNWESAKLAETIEGARSQLVRLSHVPSRLARRRDLRSRDSL